MHDYEVLGSETVFAGRIISLRRDRVSMPGGTAATRDVVEHPGAVGVVAVREGETGLAVLLVTQFRHPVRRELDELPAGGRIDEGAGEGLDGTGFDGAGFDGACRGLGRHGRHGGRGIGRVGTIGEGRGERDGSRAIHVA